MIQTISVSASGPAFSFLLYENSKTEFGQEGFLLGSIFEKETKTITDNDQQQTYITKVIKVNSVLPCIQTCSFYNSIGKVDTEKLKSFLGNMKSKVIAWYKSKPISSFKLTFREKLIHKQLSEFFNISQDLFSICLLISDCTANYSTHSYQQTFLVNKNNRYDPLPFHIVNLTDKKNCYKSAEYSSQTFQGIINKLKVNRKTSQGITFITNLQQSVQEHVETTVQELATEEDKLFNLEEEIKELLQNRNSRMKDVIEESFSDESSHDNESCELSKENTKNTGSIKKNMSVRKKN